MANVSARMSYITILGVLAFLFVQTTVAAGKVSTTTTSSGSVRPAQTTSFTTIQRTRSGLGEWIRHCYDVSPASAFDGYIKTQTSKLDAWGMVRLAATCAFMSTLWLLVGKVRRDDRDVDDSIRNLGRSGRGSSDGSSNSSEKSAVDPPLLNRHSKPRSYTLPRRGLTYPGIRTFYRPHPQADKLPLTPAPLPLLVFIHGLGGSLAQFHPLLTSLVHLAPCLGIDLPGCGLSSFAPKSWDGYTTEALVELLATVIEEHRDQDAGQKVILIGHSMGCSLAALLASPTSPYPSKLVEQTAGLLAICPKATGPPAADARAARRALYLPDFVWDAWRAWDRRGGLDSPSVIRFVGRNADTETRRLQARFNAQSNTAVLKRMIWGLLPKHDKGGTYLGGFPGKDVWAGLNLPVLLIAGEDDAVTKAKEVEDIAAFLGRSFDSGDTAIRSLLPSDVNDTVSAGRAMASASPETAAEPIRSVLKTTVVPSPAAHGLMYMPATARIVSGLLSDFMAAHISLRLSLGWQLQYLSTEGKWDVKNLKKWQAVAPVSTPIDGHFCAMKTLREVDERHRPDIFVREWAGRITDVIDISHESPVYDPRGLEKGGVKYHKLATVSKIPPTVEEVREFVDLVDQLLSERKKTSNPADDSAAPGPLIGVHCHYGFNRTGFFIVAYLVERRGYKVRAAIDEFAQCRPPGIKHDHFIDALFVRYCIGLRRAPTV